MTDIERQELEDEFNKKYAKKIKRIEEKNFLRDKKMQLRKLRRDDRQTLGLTTTKVICYYMFGLFNIVLFYSLVAMWHFADLSYLSVIISDILGQIIVFAIYSVKAYKDTNAEEKIRLEREKLGTENEPCFRERFGNLLSKVDDIAEIINSDGPMYGNKSTNNDTPDDSMEESQEEDIQDI